MTTTIKYGNSTIATAENQTKTLLTANKYVGANIEITDVSSGGVAEEKQIYFIDYDGTILHSYTKTEIVAMTSESDLPANPSHTGLTAQGWNWTLAQIKAQLTAMPDGDVRVGQMYITSSGDTEIDVVMQDGRLSPELLISVNGTVTVDWGDNTTPDTATGTSLTTRIGVLHTYASAGNYTITIHSVSGSFAFYGNSIYPLFRNNTGSTSSSRVYANCVRAVRIGNGITSIGTYAFYNCYSLASVTIPSTVTSIGTYAFYYCYSLASLTIPNTVTSIGTNTFQYCYSLASLTIPSTVTSIGTNAFGNCTSLTSVTIPSTVTSIGASAFQYCQSLTSLTIPSGVTSIGTYTFYYCYSLASVTIPNTVTSIGAYAFQYCYSLASVTIPSGVTSIGNYAFCGCNALASITIPNTVTSIGTYAFQYCYSLASVTIPSTVTSIGAYAFQYCYSLTSVTIPSTVTSIGNYAFSACSSLASLTIPSTVTSIGTYAFQNCFSLASLTIPSGVTSIGNYAFHSCYGMSEYHFLGTTPPTFGTSVFVNIESNCTIYVPTSAVADYQTALSAYTSYIQGE